jgi:hypothetical protein
MAVNVDTATASFLKLTLQNILSEVTYSPNQHHAGAPTINIQTTLCTTPICVKMFDCSVSIEFLPAKFSLN